MHPLLDRQIVRATRADGSVDVDALIAFVDLAYREADVERGRGDRAMLLACEEMDALNDELRRLAHHDPLTGLPNRLSFATMAAQAMDRAEAGECVAVLLVDLDRFKAVNDSLGHACGDALLCEVAGRLRATVRERDAIARIGGDEFAVVSADCCSPLGAEDLARRIVGELSAPYVVRGFDVSIGVSVGIALADGERWAMDALLVNADRALYRAKNEGRCTWRVFDPQKTPALGGALDQQIA